MKNLNRNIMLFGIITLMVVFIGIFGVWLHTQDRSLHDFLESEPQFCNQDSDCVLFSPCDGYTQYSISKQNIKRYTMLSEQYCKQNYSYADAVIPPTAVTCKNKICIKELIDSYSFYFVDEQNKPILNISVRCSIDNPAGIPSQFATELTKNAEIYDREGWVVLEARNHGFQGFDDVTCHFYQQQREIYQLNYSQFENKLNKITVNRN